MITQTITIVLISAIIVLGLMLALVRLAYLTGLSEAKQLVAEEKQKRLEDAARAVQEFDTKYVDLLDEDLRHRLRNL